MKLFLKGTYKKCEVLFEEKKKAKPLNYGNK